MQTGTPEPDTDGLQGLRRHSLLGRLEDWLIDRSSARDLRRAERDPAWSAMERRRAIPGSDSLMWFDEEAGLGMDEHLTQQLIWEQLNPPSLALRFRRWRLRHHRGFGAPRRFLQRGRRGWAARDAWDASDWIAEVVAGMALDIRRNGIALPDAVTGEEWHDILLRIAVGMYAWSCRDRDAWHEDEQALAGVRESLDLLSRGPVEARGFVVSPCVARPVRDRGAPHHQYERPARLQLGLLRDAEVSAANLLSGQDHGWDVALYLLGHERGAKMATHAPMYRQEFDRMLEAVTAAGRNSDAVTRQTVARLYASVQSMRWMGLRTLTRLLQGEEAGPEGSMFRLRWSRHRQQLTNAVIDAMGAHAMAPTGDPPASEDVPGVLSLMDLPGAPNSSQSWASDLLGGSQRHHQRRHIPGADEHRGRACSRPAEGATAGASKRRIAIDARRPWISAASANRRWVSAR